MRRIGLVLTAALLLGTVPSGATTVGPLSVPAFTDLGTTGASSVALPCTTLASPAPVRTPDALTGRIDGSAGVAAEDCVLHGRSLITRWKVADSPPELIGKRATVLLVIVVDGVQAFQTGTAPRSATYKLMVGDKEWVVMRVDCEGDGCVHSGNTLGPLMAPLGVTYEELPATIELKMFREAQIISSEGPATASVGVDVRATLHAVLIRAAD